MTRWVIEGTWSGYTHSQEKVVHREVTNNEKFVKALLKLGSITFSDGTCLSIGIRKANYRERVKPINGYGALINDCIRHGSRSVTELQQAKEWVETGEVKR